jgi:hypothetical protein
MHSFKGLRAMMLYQIQRNSIKHITKSISFRKNVGIFFITKLYYTSSLHIASLYIFLYTYIHYVAFRDHYLYSAPRFDARDFRVGNTDTCSCDRDRKQE